MLQSTFLHLPRVGAPTEARLWKNGVRTWDSFLAEGKLKGFSPEKKAACDDVLKESKRALHRGDSHFFRNLPSTAHWRLWNHFKDEALFVDIETDWHHRVTVLGIYDGKRVKQFVQGQNLNRAVVQEHLQGKLLVTYNGASFDLPVLRRVFGANVVPAVPHFDTRHLAARLGYRGGLKPLERSLGIRRPDEVAEMSGQDALHLWSLYQASGDEKYVEKLLAYNEEDIVNLVTVANKLVAEATADAGHQPHNV